MKTKNLFLLLVLMLSGAFITSKAQTTEATNAITNGSFLGTSNGEDIIFKKSNILSGFINSRSAAFGYNSLPTPTLYENSAFGTYAMESAVDPYIKRNTAMGWGALRDLTYGRYNTFIGYEAGKSRANGEGNTAIGSRAGGQGGSNNTYIGNGSGLQCIGSNNTYLGLNTGSFNTDALNKTNIYIGYSTGNTATGGQNNILIGSYTGLSMNGGSLNILMGRYAGQTMNGGTRNIVFGERAGRFMSGASDNVILGAYSGDRVTGSNNTILGKSAGSNFTTGSANIMLGRNSGNNFGGGSNNVFIGGLQNLAARDNTIILATGTGAQRMYIHNNGYTGLGLGNDVIPQNRLEIRHGSNNNSGLRFTNLNETSTTVASNGRVLTVNADGDVVLTTDQGSGGSTIINAGTNISVTGNGSTGLPYIISSTASNDNIYTTDGTLAGNRTVTMNNNRLMFDTDSNGAIYIGDRNDIGNNANFPMANDSYRLFVEGGILTEKVKVALRSTANWADFVFESDYKLASLKEVEAFINKNKHLPGIESADKLVENGLDLADMQAKQMQKIEELTLYVIEQDKKLKKQSEEIDKLKALVNELLKKSN
jgi:hypothetical protein